jgi:hypothetical protein
MIDAATLLMMRVTLVSAILLRITVEWNQIGAMWMTVLVRNGITLLVLGAQAGLPIQIS